MTLKETLYAILQEDAKSAVAGSLGALLGAAATDPYGIYFMHDPTLTIPRVVFFFNVQVGRLARTLYINISAYGEAYEAILKRVYTLLELKQSSFAACTDYRVLRIAWDWSGPDSYDDDTKVYYRQDRYEAKLCVL